MPVEELSVKVEWTTDKVAEPLIQPTRESEVAVYDLNIDHTEAYTFRHPIKKVAVIGAGPAGLPTAKLLLEEGLEVKIFERNHSSGGTWIYEEEKPLSPDFPSEIPTKVVQPSLPPSNAPLPYSETFDLRDHTTKEELLKLNPPTPCYRSLRNNVPTPLLKYKDFDWRKDTPWFTTHDKILEYLQDYSAYFKLDDITQFNTSLEKLEELPDKSGWNVITKRAEYSKEKNSVEISWEEETFDAVVVATGHYHAPYVPNIPGLAEWRNKWPTRVIHSKQYKTPEEFKDKTVLLIGNGTSALDISRDISKSVKKIYQSIRETAHAFDERYLQLREELSKTVPKNVQQVCGIKAFRYNEGKLSNSIQEAEVELTDGSKITDIDYVIVCTGYLFNFHFLEQLHQDPHVNSKLQNIVDDEHVLVKDGTQVYNLHKDIFYIPNPTLSFVGVPFHIATFSLFEFQSFAVSRVYSGSAKLPTENAMRAEWNERLRQKGAGREFHALGNELEMAYIRDIVNWLNRDGKALNKRLIEGHNEGWKQVREKSLPALIKSLEERF